MLFPFLIKQDIFLQQIIGPSYNKRCSNEIPFSSLIKLFLKQILLVVASYIIWSSTFLLVFIIAHFNLLLSTWIFQR